MGTNPSPLYTLQDLYVRTSLFSFFLFPFVDSRNSSVGSPAPSDTGTSRHVHDPPPLVQRPLNDRVRLRTSPVIHYYPFVMLLGLNMVSSFDHPLFIPLKKMSLFLFCIPMNKASTPCIAILHIADPANTDVLNETYYSQASNSNQNPRCIAHAFQERYRILAAVGTILPGKISFHFPLLNDREFLVPGTHHIDPINRTLKRNDWIRGIGRGGGGAREWACVWT